MTLTPIDPDTYAGMWQISLTQGDALRERSLQAASGQIGVSDIGVCKEKARRRLLGEQPSSASTNLAAIVGTFIHKGALEDRQRTFPHLLIEQAVTVTLPNGCVVPGHADEIDPDEPSVTDLKTVDGLEWVRKHGSSEQQKWQRHLYYLGAAQAGLVPENGMTRNVWIDRSGSDATVRVEQEPYSAEYVEQASSWLDDVLYAATNGEEASKDKPIPWCLSFCEFAGSCRASIDSPAPPITDPQVIETAQTYKAVSDRAKADDKYLKQAKEVLRGHEGQAGSVNVRWVQVNAAQPYQRLEVR